MQRQGAAAAALVAVAVLCAAPRAGGSFCPGDGRLHASPIAFDVDFEYNSSALASRTLPSSGSVWTVQEAAPAAAPDAAVWSVRTVLQQDAAFTCFRAGDVVVDYRNVPYTCEEEDVFTEAKRAALTSAVTTQVRLLQKALQPLRYEGEPRLVNLTAVYPNADAAALEERNGQRLADCNVAGRGAPFSFAYREEGYEADFVLYVVSAPMRYNATAAAAGLAAHAYGHPCYFAGSTHRPVVGFLNFAPHALDPADVEYTEAVVLQELVHAAAWYPSLLRTQPGGGADPTPRVYLNKWVDYTTRDGSAKLLQKRSAAETLASRPRATAFDAFDRDASVPEAQAVLVTPRVVAAAKAHLGCDFLEGVEVEDYTFGRARGGLGMVLHWEKRLFRGEVMNSVLDRGAVLSPLTTAFLADTGFYALRTGAAAVTTALLYGRAAGCRFADLPCGLWHVDPPADAGAVEASRYTCLPHYNATVLSAGSGGQCGGVGCDAGCAAYGAADTYHACSGAALPADAADVPLEYIPSALYSGGGAQVFGSAAAARRHGGCDPLMDYCFLWSREGATCAAALPQNATDCWNAPCEHFTTPGASAQCFFSDLKQAWLRDAEPPAAAGAALQFATCLPTKCVRTIFNRTAVEVTIGSTTAICHRQGQVVGPGASPAPSLYTTFYPEAQSQLAGTVLCPDPERMCAGAVLDTPAPPTPGPATAAPEGAPPPPPATPAPPVPGTARTAWHIAKVLMNGVNPCVLPFLAEEYFGEGASEARAGGAVCVLPVWEGAAVRASIEGGLVDVGEADADLWVGLGRDRECAWAGAVEFTRVKAAGEAENPTARTLRYEGGLPWWFTTGEGEGGWFCIKSRSGTTVTIPMASIFLEGQAAGSAEAALPLGWGGSDDAFVVRAFAPLPDRVTVGDRLAVRAGLNGTQLARLTGRRYSVYYAYTADAAGREMLLQGLTREAFCTTRAVPVGTHALRARLYLNDGERMSAAFATWQTEVAVGDFDPAAASVADAAASVRLMLAEVERRAVGGGLVFGDTSGYVLQTFARVVALPAATAEVYRAARALSAAEEELLLLLALEVHERTAAVLLRLVTGADAPAAAAVEDVLALMTRYYQFVSPVARTALLETVAALRAKLVFDMKAQVTRLSAADLLDELALTRRFAHVVDNLAVTIQAQEAGQLLLPSPNASTGAAYADHPLPAAREALLTATGEVRGVFMVVVRQLLSVAATAYVEHVDRYTRHYAFPKFVDQRGGLLDASLPEAQRAAMRVGLAADAAALETTPPAAFGAAVFAVTHVARALYGSDGLPDLATDVVVVDAEGDAQLTAAQQDALMKFEVDVYVDIGLMYFPTMAECECHASPRACEEGPQPTLRRVVVQHRPLPTAGQPAPEWADIMTAGFDPARYCIERVAVQDAYNAAVEQAVLVGKRPPPPPPPPLPNAPSYFLTEDAARHTTAHELAELQLYTPGEAAVTAATHPGVRVVNPWGSEEGAASAPQALDGDPATAWVDPHLGDLAVEFPTPVVLRRYALRVSAARVYRYPTRWVLEGCAAPLGNATPAAVDALPWEVLHAMDAGYSYPLWPIEAEADAWVNFTTPALPDYHLEYPERARGTGYRSYRLRITGLRGTRLTARVNGTGEVAARVAVHSVARVVRAAAQPVELDVYRSVQSEWDGTDWAVFAAVVGVYGGFAVLLVIGWANDRLRIGKRVYEENNAPKKVRALASAARSVDLQAKLVGGAAVQHTPPCAVYPASLPSVLVRRTGRDVYTHILQMWGSLTLGLFTPVGGRAMGAHSTTQKVVVFMNSALISLGVACVLYRPSMSAEGSWQRVARLGVVAGATALIGVPVQVATSYIFRNTKAATTDLEARTRAAGEKMTTLQREGDALKDAPLQGAVSLYIPEAVGLPALFRHRPTDVFFTIELENAVYRSPTLVSATHYDWHPHTQKWFPVRAGLDGSGFGRRASVAHIARNAAALPVTKTKPPTDGNVIVTFYSDYHGEENACEPLATAAVPVSALLAKQSHVWGEMDEWYELSVTPALVKRVPPDVVPRVRICSRVERHEFASWMMSGFDRWSPGEPLPTRWASRKLQRHVSWVEQGYVGHSKYFPKPPCEGSVEAGSDDAGNEPDEAGAGNRNKSISRSTTFRLPADERKKPKAATTPLGIASNLAVAAPGYRVATWFAATVPIAIATGGFFVAADAIGSWETAVGTSRGTEGRDWVVAMACAAAATLAVVARLVHRWVTLAAAMWLTMSMLCLVSGRLPALACIGGGVIMLCTAMLARWNTPILVKPLVIAFLAVVLNVAPFLMAIGHTTTKTPVEVYAGCGGALIGVTGVAYALFYVYLRLPYGFLTAGAFLTVFFTWAVLINSMEWEVLAWSGKNAQRQQVLEITFSLLIASLYLIFFAHRALCGQVIRDRVPTFVREWVYGLTMAGHALAAFIMLTYLLDPRQDGKHEGILNAALVAFWFQAFVAEPLVHAGCSPVWRQLLKVRLVGALLRFVIAAPEGPRGWEDELPHAAKDHGQQALFRQQTFARARKASLRRASMRKTTSPGAKALSKEKREGATTPSTGSLMQTPNSLSLRVEG
eukprot:TRINITY_DN1490_c0_g1_i1.p1 TRINITY_DN1490_c0_g1~~TRINITY_DN1490_c0_g1_i1.p1  ORF type:complete len:2577 (+),score=924.36 TRINITY_DN1490_c0_g1_i1:114-7844(+)